MLFDLPDDDVLYQALLERDTQYEGLAFVGVTSTGIFCRLSCPARKPKRANCVFFSNVVDCLDAGFRACQRCQPLVPAGEADPLVTQLLAALEKNPSARWSEGNIVAMGLDPSTVRRIFKRHFGITFLEMARLRRVRNGAEKLDMGADVIDAQLAAGFNSSSGFRAAFSRILGRAPSDLKDKTGLAADWIDSPLGALIAVTDAHAMHLLEFFDRKGLPAELTRLQKSLGPVSIGRYAATDQISAELAEYFGGTLAEFKTPLARFGSEFTRSVWAELQRIPLGETRSYQQIAKVLSRPAASRAVARANGANQISIVIPCHRVLGADGSLTGYGGGLWRKQWLIDHERKVATQC